MDRKRYLYPDVDIRVRRRYSYVVYPGTGLSALDMDNVRLAIFARKVRPGESTYVDVSKATVNTYVKRWQWVYDNIGGGYDWSQSNWDRRKLLSYTAEDAEKDGYTFIDDINDQDRGIRL